MNNENVENVNEEVKTEVTKEASAPQAAGQQPKQTVLLGSISYQNEADYEQFLSKLDINQALFVLIASANYGQAKGLFNLDESELVNKAIKTIKKNSTQPQASVEESTTEENTSSQPGE